LIAAGVRPLRLLPRERRLSEARRLVRSWINAYRPKILVLEATHRHSLPWLNALDRLGHSVAEYAKRHRLAVVVYAPQTVRKAIVGHGWASKAELARAIAILFPALRVYLTQDRRWKERYWSNLFDAVALAVHHQQRPL
jgi:Holliday junction resolvasome RuvABC endonuclease subunit